MNIPRKAQCPVPSGVVALAIIGAFFLLQPIWAQEPWDLGRAQKEIQGLREDVRVLWWEVEFYKTQLKHINAPWTTREHVEWSPSDPTSVTRMKLALGSNYINHGGILRVLTRDQGIIEVQPGGLLTFEAPRWTPVFESPREGRK